MSLQRNLNKFPAILAFVLLAILSVSAYAAETYKLDPEHTSVVYRVKYSGVTFVYGRFNGPTGTFLFDEALPSKSSIDMQVDANNIDTAVAKRDNHLKSPDFFNAGEHPLVTFKSTSVKKLNSGTYQVTGNLTLLGKSHKLTVNAKHTGSGKDPWGNFRRGFETSFTIKRSDFGMDFMLGGVSDEVGITVSVSGIRQ
ncbi:Protein yceI precursor [Olavius sp. associated proteobacterium Delta 1]|nr:Protein yceI precursor [Olavius sp. associated proteobacterium Delta 1]